MKTGKKHLGKKAVKKDKSVLEAPLKLEIRVWRYREKRDWGRVVQIKKASYCIDLENGLDLIEKTISFSLGRKYDVDFSYSRERRQKPEVQK
jgi:hypothetical protein